VPDPSEFQNQFTGPAITVLGSIRVYREWKFIYHEYFTGAKPEHLKLQQLTSYLPSEPWTSAQFSARCGHRLPTHASHLAPFIDCTCGIYGYNHPSNMLSTNVCFNVQGTARVSGIILMGTKGVRAQHATIESLRLEASQCTVQTDYYKLIPKGTVVVEPAEAIKFLTETYPDVAVFSDKDKWLSDFPPEDVSHLIGNDT
jgi:hypothetical protein